MILRPRRGRDVTFNVIAKMGSIRGKRRAIQVADMLSYGLISKQTALRMMTHG